MEAKKKDVRWGFISTARIGKQYLDAINALDNQAVVAVASRSVEKAKEWAEANGVPKYYGSYEEILSDPEINAIYIPLPTGMHCEWTVKAAKAGKHVLCEKPFAQSVEEAEQMIKACKENNVVLMDGVMWSHANRAKEMKRLIDEQAFGETRQVIARAVFPLTDPDNIRFKKDLEPMGCLGDVGWYCVRAVLWGYSNKLPHKVHGVAQWNNDGHEKGVPINFSGIIHYDDHGAKTALIDCSFNVARQQWFEVGAEKGGIRCTHFINAREKDTAHQFVSFNADGHEEIVKAPEANQHVEMMRTFGHLMHNPSEEEHRDFWSQLALNTQIVVDALYQSAISGQPVSLHHLHK